MFQVPCAKNGCNKRVLKEEGLLKKGRWYCGEQCAPTLEEILLEEQRLISQLARQQKEISENNKTSSSINSNDVDKEENLEVDMDLNVEFGRHKPIVSLDQLEEKYKSTKGAPL